MTICTHLLIFTLITQKCCICDIITLECLNSGLGFKVSRFQVFKFSRFQGFKVSSSYGVVHENDKDMASSEDAICVFLNHVGADVYEKTPPATQASIRALCKATRAIFDACLSTVSFTIDASSVVNDIAAFHARLPNLRRVCMSVVDDDDENDENEVDRVQDYLDCCEDFHHEDFHHEDFHHGFYGIAEFVARLSRMHLSAAWLGAKVDDMIWRARRCFPDLARASIQCDAAFGSVCASSIDCNMYPSLVMTVSNADAVTWKAVKDYFAAPTHEPPMTLTGSTPSNVATRPFKNTFFKNTTTEFTARLPEKLPVYLDGEVCVQHFAACVRRSFPNLSRLAVESDMSFGYAFLLCIQSYEWPCLKQLALTCDVYDDDLPAMLEQMPQLEILRCNHLHFRPSEHAAASRELGARRLDVYMRHGSMADRDVNAVLSFSQRTLVPHDLALRIHRYELGWIESLLELEARGSTGITLACSNAFLPDVQGLRGLLIGCVRRVLCGADMPWAATSPLEWLPAFAESFPELSDVVLVCIDYDGHRHDESAPAGMRSQISARLPRLRKVVWVLPLGVDIPRGYPTHIARLFTPQVTLHLVSTSRDVERSLVASGVCAADGPRLMAHVVSEKERSRIINYGLTI